MKALLFLGGWLCVGVVVATMRVEGPLERALALLFWPFFLVQPAQAPPRTGALERLRSALGPEAGSEAFVEELDRALRSLRARLERVEGALAELDEDQGTSRQLLEEARDRARQDLEEALAAIEESAARLVIAQSTGGEVDAILAALRHRLLAAEEVAAVS